ncbi:hypothetical protein [Neobacillus mesonae]|uniref:hypothetical protein n=1 Tax=Neobacillus mesonae TaxID=1193713 RepID=UPI00203AA83C|nr:hypothetical protein [Neobacillus mesonae]MCM3568054.1 hypothetical protein [Neobacillus mesonae]
MNETFFADYKKYIVKPVDEKSVVEDVFDPSKYASHYILTLSLFDSRISAWRDAGKYEIDIEKSIKTVLKDFNKKQRKSRYLQLLELDKFQNYFVLALSTKTKCQSEEEHERIAFIVDNIIMNPFYVGQQWFNLIGEKGKVERKLFSFSFKKYDIGVQEHPKKYELIPKNGEMKLIKTL